MSNRKYDTEAYRTDCKHCGLRAAKSDLVRILYKAGRYAGERTMAYLCRDCMAWLADELNVTMPDMDAVKGYGRGTGEGERTSWLRALEAGADLAEIQERLYKEGT